MILRAIAMLMIGWLVGRYVSDLAGCFERNGGLISLCRSIALALVVDCTSPPSSSSPPSHSLTPKTAFEIFVSEQGNQGLLGKASKQQLDSVFGTTNEDEAVKKMIELGTAKHGDALPKGFSGHNDSQCVFLVLLLGLFSCSFCFGSLVLLGRGEG